MAMHGVDKFPANELANLRSDLMQSGLDSWQAAELVSSFLTGRGYGVSTPDVRHAVTRMESSKCTIECLQIELEQLALVM